MASAQRAFTAQAFATLRPVPAFLSRTHEIVSDPRTDHIISWSKDGRTFIVWKPEELRKLLPKTLGLFTQPFASFVMELNVYGFVHYGSGNAEGDYFEFGQDGFQRGKPGLMHTIRQKENFGRYRH